MPNKNSSAPSHATHDLSDGFETVVAALATARQEIAALEAKTLELETRAKHARGTGDHQVAAREATQPIPKLATPTLTERIESALSRHSLDINQLIRVLAEPAGKVVEEMKRLRARRQIYNVGIAEHPLWTWRIGDATDASTLTETVRRLVSERPMTSRELSEATGARLSRIGGAVVALQRDAANQILDMDPRPGSSRWFLMSPGARDARLKPVAKKT